MSESSGGTVSLDKIEKTIAKLGDPRDRLSNATALYK
jgi:hypothetical protein